jgi:Mrp family chromosome partitioning ATPase
MAAVMAHDLKAEICLVDVNWWSPSDYPDGLANGGLAAVMAGEMDLQDAVVATGWSNLWLLPAGRVDLTQRPVLSRSPALKEIIDELNTRFSHLILDIPALLSTSDAVPLAALGTTCCLVIRQGITPIEDVRKALDEIEHLPVSGVVMSQVKYTTPRFLVKLLAAA